MIIFITLAESYVYFTFIRCILVFSNFRILTVTKWDWHTGIKGILYCIVVISAILGLFYYLWDPGGSQIQSKGCVTVSVPNYIDIMYSETACRRPQLS